MAKFKNVTELVQAINSGTPLKATVAIGIWKKGDKVVLQQGTAYVNGAYAYGVANGTGQGYNFSVTQLEGATQSKEELTKEIISLEEQIKISKAKLKYMEETKQEIFEETEFKVWNTLQLMKGKKTDLEKAKAIAALINS
jgi:hypothetical protein